MHASGGVGGTVADFVACAILCYDDVKHFLQKMIDGVSRVIELERMLAAGSSPAEVRAQLKSSSQGQSPALGEKHEHPYLQYGGHFNSQDAKNTMDFQYLHFDEMPRFGSQHQSAMAKHLTPALFRQLQVKPYLLEEVGLW